MEKALHLVVLKQISKKLRGIDSGVIGCLKIGLYKSKAVGNTFSTKQSCS